MDFVRWGLQSYGREFGAKSPLLYVALLVAVVLLVVRPRHLGARSYTRATATFTLVSLQYLPVLFACRGCCRCMKEELRLGGARGQRRVRRVRRTMRESESALDSDRDSDSTGSAEEEREKEE